MTTRIFLLFFSILIHIKNVASQKIEYNPLRCKGSIPQDFLELSSEKIATDKNNINEKEISNKNKNLEKKFSTDVNFGIDEILFSGKVLYGDVLTNYVNKVADIVLENDKPLRNKLRFYVLKSSSVNAFSTYKGIIFVTVGMLSQIENEAQLAFILSHEIAHYKLNHTLKSYQLKQEAIKGKGKFKQLDFDDKIKEIFNYSKENELEADKEGYEIYKNTKYANNAAETSFDMLLYSYLAYDEIEWLPNVLEDSSYKFPKSLYEFKSGTIKADEDEDDEESTHPNVRKRKESMNDLLKFSKRNDTALYLVGEKEYSYIQQQARTELFYLMLNTASYKHLYYYTYLYQKNYEKDTLYTQLLSAFSFYGLALKKSKYERDESSYSYKKYDYINNNDEDKYEGEFNKVNTFLDNLKAKDAAVLSSRTAWVAYKNNQNPFSRELFLKSIKFLFTEHEFTANYFRNNDTAAIVKQTEGKLNNGKLTKSEKLKLKQKLQVIKGDNEIEDLAKKYSYYKNAFVYYFNDSNFSFLMDSINKEVQIEKKKKEEEVDDDGINEKKYNQYITKYGKTAGIDSVILINPNYNTYHIRQNKYYQNNFVNEKNELQLLKVYEEMANKNNVSISTIDMFNRANLTTEKLNEYMTVIEWLTERIYNQYDGSYLFNSGYINKVAENRGTKYMMLSSLNYSIWHRRIKGGELALAAFSVVAFPLYIGMALQKPKEVTLSTVIYNLKTGEAEYVNRDEMKFKIKKNSLKAQIYSMFHQIKAK